ncbi:MarR family winged helix-turn-helix transcriptional regulator [Thermodesulfobium sp. 4217-1]|uniref:MarR family winged helix-turn-helix transcriptional regulator n=1 Tax=Thermodesulfobium sp. 4217-1 TaxID=3120013 RepID=UPI0032215E42
MRIFDSARELILGTRLKQLSDRYLGDVSKIYKKCGIEFEPSWFGIFFLLDRHKSLTLSEIAENMDITLSGISQIILILSKKNLIVANTIKNDKRKKVISLTAKGEDLLRRVKPIWKSISLKMNEILLEGGHSKNLLDALSEVERSFEKLSLSERVLLHIHSSKFTTQKFSPKYYSNLKKLIFHWIYDFYIPHFVSDLKNTLEKNAEHILFALKDREVAAAAIGIMENDSLNLYLFDRSDVDDSILTLISQRYIEHNLQKISSIELDSGKSALREFIEERGFKFEREKSFPDSTKMLAIYIKEAISK